MQQSSLFEQMNGKMYYLAISVVTIDPTIEYNLFDDVCFLFVRMSKRLLPWWA